MYLLVTMKFEGGTKEFFIEHHLGVKIYTLLIESEKQPWVISVIIFILQQVEVQQVKWFATVFS